MAAHLPLQDDPPAPLKFERRSVERLPFEGVATAFRLSGERFGEMHELVMLDYSAGGFAAASDRPIEPGTMLSIGFDRSDRLARRGVVRRCMPCGDGYHLAIQFQMGLAA